MTVTNSRFLAVRAEQPNISSDWSIRVLDYKNMTSPVAIINEFTAMQFTQELNATGNGSLTLDEDSPFWNQSLNNGHSNRRLLDNEYVFEAWEGNVARFAWIAQTVTNTLVDEDGTQAITISGPGIAGVLAWACINRPCWPTPVPIIAHVPRYDDPTKTSPLWRPNSYRDTVPAYAWRFPEGWTTMRMWWTVFKAAQRRGLIRWVTPMFGPLHDSGGQSWLEVKTIEVIMQVVRYKWAYKGYQPETPSESLLDFLNDCTGQDYSKWFGQRLEWIMHPGFKLDVRRTIGTKMHRSVRFFRGNIISDERTRDRQSIANRVISIDVHGNETNRTDARSVAQWNLRELRSDENANVTDNVKLKNALADRRIEQMKDEKDSWSITIPYDDPGRRPFRDFNVGDSVGFNTETNDGPPEPFRVMAISISLSGDQVVPDCELTLKSVIDLRQDEIQREVTQLINNPDGFTLEQLKAIAADGDTVVYNGETNQWETGAAGTGTTATNVYVQATDPTTDPKNTVNLGDFWLETYD